MRRLSSRWAAAALTVTALSLLASPLTAGVARAEGTDSAPAAADDGADVKPRHHHHHDDSKDAKATKAADAPPATTPPAAEAPAAAPPAAMLAPAAVVAFTPLAAVPAPAPMPAAAPTTPPTAATPLSLVPSKALELSSEPPTSNLGWKLGAIGVLAAAGFWAYGKKKAAVRVASAPIPEMRILRRTSIGVRSELLLVDLEGQRILLGVTPSNIQSLLIVPDSSMSEPVPVEEPVARVAARETVREQGRESAAALRGMPSMSMLLTQLEREERSGRTEGSVAQRAPRSEGSVAQRAPRAERSERTEGSVAQRSPRAERTEGSVAQRLPREEGSVASRLPRSDSFPKRRPSIPDFPVNTDEALEGQAEGLLAYRRGR